MNLVDVMDELAAQMQTITELNVYAFEHPSPAPPAAMMLWPSDYTYDVAYGRGADRMTLQMVVLAAKLAAGESARDALAAYLDGSGDRSVKQVLEAVDYDSLEGLRVVGADIGAWTVADTPYIAAIFDLDIIGRGA